MMSRVRLEDVKWEEFNITELFEVVTGALVPKEKIQSGRIPRITATDQNNGIAMFTNDIEDSSFKTYSNFISVSFLGSVFYQKSKVSLDMKIHGLILKNHTLNSRIAKYFIPLIKKFAMKYSYGNQLSTSVLKRQKILLPVNEEGQPNWTFMEEYIKQEQKQIAQKVIDYYEQKMLVVSFDLLGFENISWKKFKIGELFNFERKSARGLAHLDRNKKGISYLGATNRNNGVLDFVEPVEGCVYKGNAIAFIRNGEGSMGYSVYKSEDFMATQDISVGYNPNLDRYSGMFITTFADRVRGKYNFGYKRNQNRLENEIVELPIDETGSPNWDYMSKFMQTIEAEKLQEALEYIYIYIYI